MTTNQPNNFIQECLTLTNQMRHISEKQWDKRVVEQAVSLMRVGAGDDLLDAVFATAGLKHECLKREALNGFKQERRKQATTNRLRAKLAARKSGM